MLRGGTFSSHTGPEDHNELAIFLFKHARTTSDRSRNHALAAAQAMEERKRRRREMTTGRKRTAPTDPPRWVEGVEEAKGATDSRCVGGWRVGAMILFGARAWVPSNGRAHLLGLGFLWSADTRRITCTQITPTAHSHASYPLTNLPTHQPPPRARARPHPELLATATVRILCRPKAGGRSREGGDL